MGSKYKYECEYELNINMIINNVNTYYIYLCNIDFEIMIKYWFNEGHTESQNHRNVEVERDRWWASGSAPLLKQGHLDQVAQDHVQAAFEHLQAWRLHNLPGQAVPVLSHVHGKNLFPDV